MGETAYRPEEKAGWGALVFEQRHMQQRGRLRSLHSAMNREARNSDLRLPAVILLLMLLLFVALVVLAVVVAAAAAAAAASAGKPVNLRCSSGLQTGAS